MLIQVYPAIKIQAINHMLPFNHLKQVRTFFKSSHCFVALLFFYLLTPISSFAQKPTVDLFAKQHWAVVDDGKISSDGKYAMFTTKNDQGRVDITTIQSTNLAWKKEILSSSAFFLGNRRVIYQKAENANRSYLLDINSGEEEEIKGYCGDLLDKKGSVWVSFMQEGQWRIRCLDHRGEYVIKSTVKRVIPLHLRCDSVLVEINPAVNKSELILLNLKNGNQKKIWTGYKIVSSLLNFGKKLFAYATVSPDNIETEIWCLNIDKCAPDLLVDSDLLSLAGLHIESLIGFDRLSKHLVINFRRSSDTNSPSLRIWSYTDNLMPSQREDFEKNRSFTGVVNLSDHHFLMLSSESDHFSLRLPNKGMADYVIGDEEYYGDDGYRTTRRFLINVNNGERRLVPVNGELSYDSLFYVFFDTEKQAFCSTNLKSNVTNIITKGVATQWYDTEPGYMGQYYPQRGKIACWKKDSNALLYDAYDIWLADLTGAKPAVNITHGYGAKNHIIFSTLNEKQQQISSVNSLILTGFNTLTKKNGFFKTRTENIPEKLVFDDHSYFLKESQEPPDASRFIPVKAADCETYLLKICDATSSYNFWVTKNFKAFKQLSFIAPEKKYNWLTTTLKTWTTPDGITASGILYKPENFDSTKKYPLIVYCYQQLSDNLNTFIVPELGSGKLSIPEYVSNGYLVFTPDIHHPTLNNLYAEALTTVESGVNELKKLSFVDTAHIGLQGISWGGILTNYFITHSNMFTAACSASGMSDFLSGYNGLIFNLYAQDYYRDIGGPGKTIWEDMGWYIKNSPVFGAPHVTTPLLMMETPSDTACPYVNAFELYNALRFLRKPVWMLEYKNGNHGVWGDDAVDFDSKLRQFFDHYLKDCPMPDWMKGQ